MASSENQTSVEYIKHHLQNLQVCKTDEGWVWNNCLEAGFWTINVDSLIISFFLGALFCFGFWRVAKTAKVENPGRWQSFTEMVFEFVDKSVKDTFHGKKPSYCTISINHLCMDLLNESNGLSPSRLITLGS